MSAPLVMVVALIYSVVAYERAAHHDWPDALVWFSYALANVGFAIRYVVEP